MDGCREACMVRTRQLKRRTWMLSDKGFCLSHEPYMHQLHQGGVGRSRRCAPSWFFGMQCERGRPLGTFPKRPQLVPPEYQRISGMVANSFGSSLAKAKCHFGATSEPESTDWDSCSLSSLRCFFLWVYAPAVVTKR